MKNSINFGKFRWTLPSNSVPDTWHHWEAVKDAALPLLLMKVPLASAMMAGSWTKAWYWHWPIWSKGDKPILLIQLKLQLRSWSEKLQPDFSGSFKKKQHCRPIHRVLEAPFWGWNLSFHARWNQLPFSELTNQWPNYPTTQLHNVAAVSVEFHHVLQRRPPQ